jgi:hypothetical protein
MFDRLNGAHRRYRSEELVALAKAKAGTLNYGSSGNGTIAPTASAERTELAERSGSD